MPLDRKITVRHATPGMRNQYGEFEPGPVNEYDLWATLMPRGAEDIIEVGGARVRQERAWRIRWNADLVGLNPNSLSVFDGEFTYSDSADGVVPRGFSVENVKEDNGRGNDIRRRWLIIQGLFST